MRLPREEALLDLLAARATEGLDPADEQQLPEEWRGNLELDLAAAAIDVASLPGELEPMPAEVRVRLDTSLPGVFRPKRGTGWRRLAGRAAAVLVAALVLFGIGLALQDGGDPAEPPALENAVRWSWQAKDPRYRDVRGEVVWDGARQEGWMVFEGLPPNDPRKGQYQLWIVDSKRFEHPVDGGVFDVRGETARVPIDAKLHVPDAEAFVVTYEQPGGVVVSDGPHLLVAAEKT